MSNYAESKKVLDKIRNEYNCKGDVLFRSALQIVVEAGQCTVLDDTWYQTEMNDIDSKHNQAEKENKTLWIARDFEKAILECAREIAKVNTYDLLIYTQKEVWLSNEGGMDYRRAVDLLKYTLEYLEGYNNCNNKENYEAFCDIGLDDDEIEAFGFGYLIPTDEEE